MHNNYESTVHSLITDRTVIILAKQNDPLNSYN